jgi:hypothetical protein
MLYEQKMDINDEFKTKMTEWVDLKKQLNEVKSDVKKLNAREKTLKEFIKNYMIENEIDNVNLRKGKVAVRTSKKKTPLSFTLIEAGLGVYFDHQEDKVANAITCIKDQIECKESHNISLTGIKM